MAEPRGGETWRLVPVDHSDEDPLAALFDGPSVHEFLFDGAPPPRQFIRDLIQRSATDFATAQIGVWKLVGDGEPLAGIVSLRPADDERAELLYALAPSRTGRGLATKAVAATIEHAFANTSPQSIVAGADCPNRRSIALMERVGMRRWRDVDYPLGPGVEYVIDRTDPRPAPHGEIAVSTVR